jgi:prolyl-tRNA editing enzyme YbaK/EbsC (Cys-tRNA(Pro) deacylase)
VTELSRSAARVADELVRLGLETEVLELPDSTRTAVEAAQALRCEVAQIVKSVVFRVVERDVPVIVLASGINRVDEEKLARLVGSPVEQASGRFVRERTGFAIGGVPPLGHSEAVPTYFDEDLLAFELVWAAAGTPRSVFSARPAELARAARSTVVDIATSSAGASGEASTSVPTSYAARSIGGSNCGASNDDARSSVATSSDDPSRGASNYDAASAAATGDRLTGSTGTSSDTGS